jgi:hypothetical protein
VGVADDFPGGLEGFDGEGWRVGGFDFGRGWCGAAAEEEGED